MLPHFKHTPKWTPGDVALMKRCLMLFFRSPEGRLASRQYAEFEQSFWVAALEKPDPAQLIEMMEQDGKAEQRAQFWATADPIWVDDSFTQMMLAAASTATPEQGLQPYDLIAPEGAVFFSTLLEGLDLPGLEKVIIRALTWSTVLDTGGNPKGVMIQTWYETSSDRFLWRHLVGVCTFKPSFSDDEIQDGIVPLVRMLRALTAIAGTSYAVDDRVDVHSSQAATKPKGKKRRKASPPRTQKIRRLYLRHPEYGAAELDSARGRTPKRLHWVRGHWRKQWYASVEESRTIWVEGHPRGNRELGVVHGERVLIAKGDPS